VFWNTSAFWITCWPGCKPEMISLHVVGYDLADIDFDAPKFLVADRSVDPVTIVQVQNSGGRHRGMCLFFCREKVAVTNMPIRISPGLLTSIRTLAVRSVGSRTGRILLMRPVNT